MAAEGEPVAVAEGDSLNGYAPLDSIEEGAPIGHGVNQFFGSAETVEGALLDESTTGITIEEGVSLDGFSGVDSVVVDPETLGITRARLTYTRQGKQLWVVQRDDDHDDHEVEVDAYGLPLDIPGHFTRLS